METGSVLILLGLGSLLYFLPSIVASSRGHINGCAIGIVNLFLGWTLIGWVVALSWAFTAQPQQPQQKETPK